MTAKKKSRIRICLHRNWELDGIEIERAHRVKLNDRDSNTNRHRTIVVKLLRFKDKTKIFQNANKLKGQNIFINNDFSKATLELRKELMVEVKRLRELSKIAYLNYTTIVSREKSRGVNVKINIKNKFFGLPKMQFESDFECLSFDPFFLQENFIINKCDPDVNFYQNNVSNVKANYFLMTEVESSLASFDPNAFSVLHLNIRSMKKNFENFKEFLKNLRVSFSAICLSETWCESQNESQNSNYILSGYNFLISIGNIAEQEECVFLLKNRFVAKLGKICQYIVISLNRYVWK